MKLTKKKLALMKEIALEPRITLTDLSRKTGTSISTIFDRLRSINKTHKLKGHWVEIGEPAEYHWNMLGFNGIVTANDCDHARKKINDELSIQKVEE